MSSVGLSFQTVSIRCGKVPIQSTKWRVLFLRSLAHTAAKLVLRTARTLQAFVRKAAVNPISFHKFWLTYCPKALNQAYYPKPSPWGASRRLSHAQHPAEPSHHLLQVDVLKNPVITGKLHAWHENFLSSMQITEMPQKFVQALNYSVFSFLKNEEESLVLQTTVCLCWEQDPQRRPGG